MTKMIRIFVISAIALLLNFGVAPAMAQSTTTSPTTIGGIPLNTGYPTDCSCTVDALQYACGIHFDGMTSVSQACPLNFGGTETATTSTPYICAGQSNPETDGPSVTTIDSSTCLPLTAVPTYSACSSTCGTGMETVTSYYCADSTGKQYPASDCTAPASKTCTDTSACCPSNPANGSYSGLQPNCTLTCNAGYTAYNGSCPTSCPVNTVSTSYSGEPDCTATCNAGYVVYNGACIAACPANTASTTYSEPSCAPVCNAGYTSYNGSCITSCPVNTASTSYSEPDCSPVCNAGYTSYNGACIATCPVNTASTTYSEPSCAPVCNTGYTMVNNACVALCPADPSNGMYSAPPQCTLTCSVGYTATNGQCVANPCPANPANGLYGVAPQCALACNAGYTASNGQCVANPCPANPANGMYGAAPQCTLACDAGYTASNGQCVANPCPANPANGMYGAAPQCALTCNTGYMANNGQCVANPCPANPANGMYGAAPQCTLTCDAGYTVSNGTCTANPVNGACGPDDNGNLQDSVAPWSNAYSGLCSSGVAINGAGPGSNADWTWQCQGANGGSTIGCSEQQYFRSACSAAGLQDITGNGTGLYYFTADGTRVGSSGCCAPGYSNNAYQTVNGVPNTIGCNAPVTGACGSACGVEDPNNPGTDGSQLCSAGTATPVTLSGNTWSWMCDGAYGGGNITGSAPRYNIASCAQGGLSGNGTIDYDKAGWVSTSGCCYPSGYNNQNYTLNGAAVPGCNAPIVAATEVCGGSGKSCATACGGYACSGGYMEPNDNLGDHCVVEHYENGDNFEVFRPDEVAGCSSSSCYGGVCTNNSDGGGCSSRQIDVPGYSNYDTVANIQMYPENAQGVCQLAGYAYLVYWTFDVDQGKNDISYASDYNSTTKTWGKHTSSVHGAGSILSVWCANVPPPGGYAQGAVMHPNGSMESGTVTTYLPHSVPNQCAANTTCAEAPISAGPH